MQLGEINTLVIDRQTSVGLFLVDEHENDVLLPNKFVPEEWEEGDKIEVFLFKDSEGRLCATTEKPNILVNTFAALKVIHNTRVGTFVDWGLDKDLLVPFSEQHETLKEGNRYVIFLLHDNASDRLIGSSKIHKYLSPADNSIRKGDEVSIIPFERMPMGTRVIVDHKFKGMVYQDEQFEELTWGEERLAFVKNIRPDGKIDVSLKAPGYGHVAGEAEKILSILRRNGGVLQLHDKSAPEEIYEALEMSKKSFKKAIGSLYKARLIKLEDKQIRLIES